MKRDGYKNKYTNPKQDGQKWQQTNTKWKFRLSKLTKNKNLKNLQVSKTQQEATENSDMVTCDKCGKTFKKRGLKLHTTLKHATALNKTE